MYMEYGGKTWKYAEHFEYCTRQDSNPGQIQMTCAPKHETTPFSFKTLSCMWNPEKPPLFARNRRNCPENRRYHMNFIFFMMKTMKMMNAHAQISRKFQKYAELKEFYVIQILIPCTS